MQKSVELNTSLIWQKSKQLIAKIYNLTGTFPRAERFGLVIKMRKVTVSVAANIGEGFASARLSERRALYNASWESLSQLKRHFLIANKLGYCDSKKEILGLTDEIHELLSELIEETHTEY